MTKNKHWENYAIYIGVSLIIIGVFTHLFITGIGFIVCCCCCGAGAGRHAE